MKTVKTRDNEDIPLLLQQMEQELEKTNQNTSDLLTRTRSSIKVARNAVDRLKSLVLEQEFESKQDEIRFFKEIKPRFVSQLIYHCRFYQIQCSMPLFRNRLMEEYLLKQITRIEYFIHKHRTFYQYMKNRQDQLDEQYFIRGTEDTWLSLDNYFFNSDIRFSTGYDYLVSSFIAYERLGGWLSGELQDLPQHFLMKKPIPQKLGWTGTKTALIELIYGLQTVGVFNNSTADIKQIADSFEYLFQVDLGGYYRTFQELRYRKKNRTAFLDQMKEGLIRRMDEADATFSSH